MINKKVFKAVIVWGSSWLAFALSIFMTTSWPQPPKLITMGIVICLVVTARIVAKEEEV